MQFTLKLNFVPLTAAMAVLTSAAPAIPVADVDGHVFVCTDVDFAGDCSDYGFVNDVCSNFPPEFQNDISSFGPDQGFECITYTDNDCSPAGLTYTAIWPGFSTLPPGINDAISSVICFPQ
ncbi:hypothetical protein C8F01DRAFT_1262816 [Mycena amicta]|nr:hypothetical protein C8F01DRAFT_1262816 [Mycena amicta]